MKPTAIHPGRMKSAIHWFLFLMSFFFTGSKKCETDASTIIATKCRDGIVLAADSLSASGGSGILISSRTSKKVFILTQSTAICTVSSSANAAVHFQQLYHELRETIRSHQTSFESTLTSSAIINVARQLVCHKYNEAHVVIAGWEGASAASKAAEQIPDTVECNYVLSEILPGGSRMDQNTVVAGTGATLISNLLDETLRQKDHTVSALHEAANGNVGGPVSADTAQLSVAEALPKLRRCLSLAAKLDPQTGGDKFSLWVLAKHSNESEDGGVNAESISAPLS